MRARYIHQGAKNPQAQLKLCKLLLFLSGVVKVSPPPPNTKGWVKKSSLQRRLKGGIQKTRGMHSLRS